MNIYKLVIFISLLLGESDQEKHLFGLIVLPNEETFGDGAFFVDGTISAFLFILLAVGLCVFIDCVVRRLDFGAPAFSCFSHVDKAEEGFSDPTF